jgi:hypothetical protein
MHQVIELSMDISNNDDRFFNSNKVRLLLCSHEISIFFNFFELTQKCCDFYEDTNQAFFCYVTLNHQMFSNQIEVWDLSSILKLRKTIV